MKIETNSMVKYHYRLTDADTGELLESTHGEQEVTYVHGVSQTLKGLEEALAGKSKGDAFDVTVPPNKAYGAYNPDAVGRVSLNYVSLPGGRPIRGKLKPGTDVEIRTGQRIYDGTLVKQGLKTADVDINHPYAGKSLKFFIDITDVRTATTEEISGSSCGSGCGCCG